MAMYSELSSDRYEIRKVECFSDDKTTYAYDNISTGKSSLGELPVPPISEIAEDLQFKPMVIDKREFEMVWAKAILQ